MAQYCARLFLNLLTDRCAKRTPPPEEPRMTRREAREGEAAETVMEGDDGSSFGEGDDEVGSGDEDPWVNTIDCTGINGALLPYPNRCAGFYICDNGVPKLRRCAKGTVFNPGK